MSMKTDMKDSCWIMSTTFVVFGTAITSGLNDGLIGPTLPSLAYLSSSSSSEMSTIFTWRSGFSIAGSLVIGHLLDKFNPAWLISIALFFQAVFAIVAPWLNHMVAISAISGLSAFFSGGVTAGMYTVIFSMYEKKAGPFVQAVRMCYIGGLGLAPIVAEPFIIDSDDIIQEDYDNNFEIFSNETQQNSTWASTSRMDFTSATTLAHTSASSPMNFTTEATTLAPTSPGYVTPILTNSVQFAYLTVALIVIVWSVVFFVLGFIRRKWSLNPQGSSVPLYKMEKTEITLLVITLLMTFVYGGMDVGVGGLLYTFVTEYLLWTNSEGILVNSVYQIVKIAVLGATIFIAMIIHPKWFVCADLFLLFGTSFAAMSSIQSGDRIAMWVCTVSLGIGFANLYVSNMSWLSKRVMVTGQISALFNVAFNGGVMAITPLIGLALDDLGIRGFGIVISVCSSICVILLGLTALVILKGLPSSGATTADSVSSDGESSVDSTV